MTVRQGPWRLSVPGTSPGITWADEDVKRPGTGAAMRPSIWQVESKVCGPDLDDVGRLDRRHPFATGRTPTPTAFVSKLARLCEEPVGMTRGWHSCNLCDERAPQPGQTSVTVDGADVLVGSAEIRVPAADGAVFEAPNMILHYVADHRYLPPMEFVNAVTGSLRAMP